MSAIDWAERGLIPDSLIRFGIRRLCRRRLHDEGAGDPQIRSNRYALMLDELRTSPIAIETDAANEQHYELPPEFFLEALGSHLKYSSCYYATGGESLDEAEAAMLSLSCQRAELDQGQQILELGCGWGSLTLWMATHFPESRITAVSNSAPQRRFIMAQAAARGLDNVEVITADVNEFDIGKRFDRVVSVEMFEHMRNYATLMQRISEWLKPDGKLFVHLFCHKQLMYPFESQGDDNWMGRYFFTGGLMPAADSLLEFQQHLKLEDRWTESGTHYQRTAEHWLENMDHRRNEIMLVMARTYGEQQARTWFQRWRIFFMSCAELFGYDRGGEWQVGHYRFVKSHS